MHTCTHTHMHARTHTVKAGHFLYVNDSASSTPSYIGWFVDAGKIQQHSAGLGLIYPLHLILAFSFNVRLKMTTRRPNSGVRKDGEGCSGIFRPHCRLYLDFSLLTPLFSSYLYQPICPLPMHSSRRTLMVVHKGEEVRITGKE